MKSTLKSMRFDEPITLMASATCYNFLDSSCACTLPFNNTFNYAIDYKELANEVAKELTISPGEENKCRSCGGVLQYYALDRVYKCPFCHNTYSIKIKYQGDR